METKDLGRLFVLRAPVTDQKIEKLVWRQPTWELDSPYRYSNAVVFRFRSKGYMVGWWRKSPAVSLEDHFKLALGAQEVYNCMDSAGKRAVFVRNVSWDDMTQKERATAYPQLKMGWPGIKNPVDILAYDDGGQGRRLDEEPF